MAAEIRKYKTHGNSKRSHAIPQSCHNLEANFVTKINWHNDVKFINGGNLIQQAYTYVTQELPMSQLHAQVNNYLLFLIAFANSIKS